MSVIAVHGIRGGVGSTSITAGIAWALHQLEESVLILDLSSDNLLRMHFNMSFHESRGWARAYVDNTPWQESAMRYMPLLDFLPFGSLSNDEQLTLETKYQKDPDFIRNIILELVKSKKYRWILLDVPSNSNLLTYSGLASADTVFTVLNPDANCHVRIHQQEFVKNSYFLINKFAPNKHLEWDLHLLWQQSLPNLVPIIIHADQAVAEALANKQPVGEYQSHSLAAEELLTLTNWCLIHLAKKIKSK